MLRSTAWDRWQVFWTLVFAAATILSAGAWVAWGAGALDRADRPVLVGLLLFAPNLVICARRCRPTLVADERGLAVRGGPLVPWADVAYADVRDDAVLVMRSRNGLWGLVGSYPRPGVPLRADSVAVDPRVRDALRAALASHDVPPPG